MWVFLESLEPLRKAKPCKWARALRVLHCELRDSSAERLARLHRWLPDAYESRSLLRTYYWSSIEMNSFVWRDRAQRTHQLAYLSWQRKINARRLAGLDVGDVNTSFDIVGALPPGMYP